LLQIALNRLLENSTNAEAVHVWFFDAPNNGGYNNLSDDYYASAVARIELLVPIAHYFVFSDRPEEARASILLPENRITVVTHNQRDTNAHADLWLMTLCKHFIISNSTLFGGVHGWPLK
jgi:hypothetical protein